MNKNKVIVLCLMFVSFVIGSAFTLYVDLVKKPTFPMPSKVVFKKIDDLSWNHPDVWEYVNELQKFIKDYNNDNTGHSPKQN